MGEKTALIATLPKSGTWYAHAFFWCYDQLLQRADDYLAGAFKPDLVTALSNGEMPNLTTHPETLGIDQLYICHSVCPGFATSDDVLAGLWQALSFPLPYNWGEDFVRASGSWEKLDPALNPDARIVYLCRNPLDHFVSYFRHAQNHIDAAHRMKLMSDGSMAPIRDLHDFVFGAGMLGAFIKHYYSFRQMQERYPRQVLIMPYEQLTTDPRRAFDTILKFLGSAPEGPLKQRLFTEALTLSSKESMTAVEARLTGSLGGDQMRGDKHMRGGEIGKWKKHFSDGDLGRIEAAFQLFGISLCDFDLFGPGDKRDISWLKTLASGGRQEYQVEFLAQELSLAGTRLRMQSAAAAADTWLQQTARHLKNLLRHSVFAPPLRALRKRLRAPSPHQADAHAPSG